MVLMLYMQQDKASGYNVVFDDICERHIWQGTPASTFEALRAKYHCRMFRVTVVVSNPCVLHPEHYQAVSNL